MLHEVITSPEKLQLILDDYESSLSLLSEDELKAHKASFSLTGNPYQHLKNALYDFRVEAAWDNSASWVISINDTTIGFFSFTTREPKHVTIRHIMSLPGAQRGQAKYMLKVILPTEAERRGISRLRFFPDKKAEGFYQHIGFTEYHGHSKIGLLFYYGSFTGELIDLPQSQKRYCHKPFHKVQSHLSGIIDFGE